MKEIDVGCAENYGAVRGGLYSISLENSFIKCHLSLRAKINNLTKTCATLISDCLSGLFVL